MCRFRFISTTSSYAVHKITKCITFLLCSLIETYTHGIRALSLFFSFSSRHASLSMWTTHTKNSYNAFHFVSVSIFLFLYTAVSLRKMRLKSHKYFRYHMNWYTRILITGRRTKKNDDDDDDTRPGNSQRLRAQQQAKSREWKSSKNKIKFNKYFYFFIFNATIFTQLRVQIR